eukprot:gene14712-19776_t
MILSVKANSQIPKIRDYNKVTYTIYSSFPEFFIDQLVEISPTEIITKNNMFLGIAEAHCFNLLTENPLLIGAQHLAGGNVISVAILPKNEFKLNDNSIHIINHGGSNKECATVYYYPKGSNIQRPQESTSDFNRQSFHAWTFNQIRVKDLKFINGFDFPIQIFWHDESTSPRSNGVLQPRESFTLQTFLGHTFSASALEPNEFVKELYDEYDVPAYNNVVDFMVVSGPEYFFSPFNRLESCEINLQESTTFVESDLLSCDNMAVRMKQFTQTVWHDKRLGLNFVQPQVVRGYSELGFVHTQLPKETYSWLKAWYEQEQKKLEEEESLAGPCMNQLVAPSTITHITPDYKQRLTSELQPMLESWYGGELEMTSIYGIRKYINGSILRMHVDTVITHVVSAIINVDQEVDKDWPLLILDHEDNEHNIVMKPGDMVLYESAKSLHGRP